MDVTQVLGDAKREVDRSLHHLASSLDHLAKANLLSSAAVERLKTTLQKAQDDISNFIGDVNADKTTKQLAAGAVIAPEPAPETPKVEAPTESKNEGKVPRWTSTKIN